MASPYRKRHDNFAQQESEYKDIVISKLKASAFELHQNEQECDDLSLRLNNLHHRLNLLQNEKDLDEKEHNHRNDLNTKTIYNLKDEVRALEAELQKIEDDIALRRDDNDGVNRIISSRSAELAKLKCQLADLADDNKALTFEIKDLEHQNNKLKKEIEEDLEFSQQVNHKIEEASQRRDNSQKIIRELEGEEEELIKQNNQLKAEQKDVRLTVANRSENLKEAEYELSENRKDIVALQARVDNQKRANERLNKEIAIGQQEQEKESAKAADQSSKIKVLEELNQEREDEIQELRRQLAQLRKENNENLDENDDLNNDIEASNKHLDALTYEHHQLLEEIERFDHEDAGVRRVLQRESRVMNTKAKYEDKMRSSLSTMNTTLQSPTKSAGLNSALSKAH